MSKRKRDAGGRELKVRYARDETGRIMSIDEAKNEASSSHVWSCIAESCPNPKLSLRAQDSKYMTAHWSHHGTFKLDDRDHSHSPESLQHRVAKQLISAHIAQWTFAVQPCSGCSTPNQTAAFAAHHGSEEHPVGAYRLDVGVLDSKDRVVAAIEIEYTHRTGAERTRALAELRIATYEVQAAAVIDAHRSGRWYVSCRRLDGKCQECVRRNALAIQAARVRAQEEAEEQRREAIRRAAEDKRIANNQGRRGQASR